MEFYIERREVVLQPRRVTYSGIILLQEKVAESFLCNLRTRESPALYCCWRQLLYNGNKKLDWTTGGIFPPKTFNWEFPHSVPADLPLSHNQATL